MHRVYEIFEVLPNGSPEKVTVVPGLEFAKLTLEALAKRTSNECFAADTKTHQIVMQLNVAATKLRRIFQISYNEKRGIQRAELLRARGYGVISVNGNQAAKVVLSSPDSYDLFIVGGGAPEEIRTEMAGWLRAEYPKVKILALNPPNEEVAAADDNVQESDAENWLLVVSQRVTRHAMAGYK